MFLHAMFCLRHLEDWHDLFVAHFTKRNWRGMSVSQVCWRILHHLRGWTRRLFVGGEKAMTKRNSSSVAATQLQRYPLTENYARRTERTHMALAHFPTDCIRGGHIFDPQLQLLRLGSRLPALLGAILGLLQRLWWSRLWLARCQRSIGVVRWEGAAVKKRFVLFNVIGFDCEQITENVEWITNQFGVHDGYALAICRRLVVFFPFKQGKQ